MAKKTDKLQIYVEPSLKEFIEKKAEENFLKTTEYLRQLVCKATGYVPVEKGEK